MIDLKTLRELVKLMVSNDLTELDLQDQGERVSLKRGRGEVPVAYMTPPVPASVPVAAPATGAPGTSPPAAPVDEGLVPITSPMVGTFYTRPSPDSKAFVNVGDRVASDTVVCLILAMKVHNEIHAEKAGTIEKILVTDGQAVEFGQPLFLLRPS